VTFLSHEEENGQTEASVEYIGIVLTLGFVYVSMVAKGRSTDRTPERASRKIGENA
jgi:ABC-type spermidine/putrescine transport system permease subunit II